MVLRFLYRQRWVVGVVLALVLPACSPVGRSRPNSEAPSPSITLLELEAGTRRRINQLRQENGLPALQRNEVLAQVARNYSRQMATQNFFDHKDPSGRDAVQRVHSAGLSFQLIGENLHRSRNADDPIETAIKSWMDSPGHRANILRPIFTETGIGVWRDGNQYYFTQLFMQP
jgi:uncharacterized protein YkwD